MGSLPICVGMLPKSGREGERKGGRQSWRGLPCGETLCGRKKGPVGLFSMEKGT